MICPINLQSLVEEAKRQAYRNGQDLVLTDGRAIMGPSMPYTNLMPEPNLLVQQPDFSVENQGINSKYAE